MESRHIKLAAAAIILGVAIIAILRSTDGPEVAPRPASAYFLNVTSGELQMVPLDSIPPLDGGQSVRAYVYTCSSCEPDQWTIDPGLKASGYVGLSLRPARFMP